MGGLPLARGHAADHLAAIGDHFLGVEAADIAGETLDQDLRVGVQKDAHGVDLPVDVLRSLPLPLPPPARGGGRRRSEEHTSELQSLMRISYAVFCLKKK